MIQFSQCDVMLLGNTPYALKSRFLDLHSYCRGNLPWLSELPEQLGATRKLREFRRELLFI